MNILPRYAPRLIAREQLAVGSSAGLVLAIDEGECLPVAVADDVARGVILNVRRVRWRLAFNSWRWAVQTWLQFSVGVVAQVPLGLPVNAIVLPNIKMQFLDVIFSTGPNHLQT